MRLQLLNKQIIDEREEGLANKAGAETAGFLFLALTVFSVGSIFTSKVGLSPIMVVALLIVSGLYYYVRCQRLGVKFISYSYLNVTGIVAVTSILSLFIWAQNFQLNLAVYQSNPFHSKFLLVLPITFLLNLPIVWGVNTLVMLLAKVEKNAMKPIWIRWKRKSRKLEPWFRRIKVWETRLLFFSQINCIRFLGRVYWYS